MTINHTEDEVNVTEEMLKAGLDAFWKSYGSNISQIAVPLEGAFKAMLEVSQQTPKVEQRAYPSNDALEQLWGDHFGHPADFGAAVLEQWGGWQEGLLGYRGDALEVDSLRNALNHAADWIGNIPHSKNCFKHNDRCLCGKYDVLSEVNDVLTKGK